MCRFLLDTVDLNKLESKKKQKLTKHLEGRKKELLAQVKNIDRALKAVKKKRRSR
jgi:hypothetical protein